MKRPIIIFIGVVVFILLAGRIYAQNEDNKKKKNGLVSFGLDIRIPSFVSKTYVPTTLSNVPEFVRQVPIHKDDSSSGKIITIPNSTVQPCAYFVDEPPSALNPSKITASPVMWGASVAPQITIGWLKARAGVSFYQVRKDNSWLLESAYAQDETATKGLPYTGPLREWSEWGSNSLRGFGTALVYYAAELKPKFPEWFGEIEIGPFKYLSGVVGYTQRDYNLNLWSGWDRYNSLTEVYKKFPPIAVRTQREYFGVRLSGNLGDQGESRSRIGIEFLVNHHFHSDQSVWEGYPVNLTYTQSPWSVTGNVFFNVNLFGAKKN